MWIAMVIGCFVLGGLVGFMTAALFNLSSAADEEQRLLVATEEARRRRASMAFTRGCLMALRKLNREQRWDDATLQDCIMALDEDNPKVKG